MDPDNIPQDVARCDLCKTAIAQNYCDFCHVNLCKPCIGEHISDEYDKHKIVPFLQRKSTLIYPKCETHQNATCKYQCKDCDVFVCSHCTASSQHMGHKFVNLKELFSTLKRHIKSDVAELRNLIIPAYTEIVIDLENDISNIDGEYEKLLKEISKQREEIHKHVDNAFNKMEKKIGEMKMKHHIMLKKQLNETRHKQSLIKKSQDDLTELEECNNVWSTIQYISKNKEFSHPPPRISVKMPRFVPKQIDMVKLCSLFGELSPLSTILEEGVLIARKPELLEKPEILHTFKTGHTGLRCVICLNEKQILASGKTFDIKCFNISGVLQKTIKTKWPNDIAVDQDRALLYLDGRVKSVFKVKNNQTERIIRLEGWTPNNLSATSSGDLLVTMYRNDETQSKVVRYSGSNVKQTIQFDDEGQPLYSGNGYIKYISENRNLDICVADCGAGAVVVVNQTGKLRFRYTAGHRSPAENEPFKPNGITTDNQNRILTSDCDNHRIHIIDANGQFLRYIDNCDTLFPYGLCIDNEKNLLVCEFRSGNVKKIKYLA